MGLGAIGAILKRDGHEISIWNQDLHHWPDEALTDYLDNNKFDMVVVSLIAGYYQYRRMLGLSKAINNSKQVCLSVNQDTGIKKVLIKQAEKKSTNIKFVKKQGQYQFKYLYGFHNQQNAELAKAIIVELNKTKNTNITNAEINKSVFNTKWDGRFQVLQNHPTIIYDVAHNKSSLNCFINSFSIFSKVNNYEKKSIILAFEENKKIRTVLKAFEKHFNSIICSETNIRKSMKCEDIKKIFLKKAVIKKNLNKAIISTINQANKKDCIVILGSHYIAPTLNNILKNCFVHK